MLVVVFIFLLPSWDGLESCWRVTFYYLARTATTVYRSVVGFRELEVLRVLKLVLGTYACVITNCYVTKRRDSSVMWYSVEGGQKGGGGGGVEKTTKRQARTQVIFGFTRGASTRLSQKARVVIFARDRRCHFDAKAGASAGEWFLYKQDCLWPQVRLLYA